MMITIGWLTFLAAWVMNICFYKTHPSAVDFSPKRFKDKMFIYIFGKKYNLICSLSSCLGCTACSDCCCSSNSDCCYSTCTNCFTTCSDCCCSCCSTCSNGCCSASCCSTKYSKCCKDDEGDSDYYQRKETSQEMEERGRLIADNGIQQQEH